MNKSNQQWIFDTIMLLFLIENLFLFSPFSYLSIFQILPKTLFVILGCIFLFFFFRQIGNIYGSFAIVLKSRVLSHTLKLLVFLIFSTFFVSIPYVFSQHPSLEPLYRNDITPLVLLFILGFLTAFFGFSEGAGKTIDQLRNQNEHTKKQNISYYRVIKVTLFLIIPWLAGSLYVAYITSTLIQIPGLHIVVAILVFLILFGLFLLLSIFLYNSTLLHTFLEKSQKLRQTGEWIMIVFILNIWDSFIYQIYAETIGFWGLICTGILPLRVLMLLEPVATRTSRISGVMILIGFVLSKLIG